MRRLGRYRWSTAAAGAVLLLVLFVVTWALRLDHGRRVSQTEVTATVTTPPARTTPSALIVGDSYTAGTGAGSSRAGYACRAAAAMAWSCNLDTQGGTGYVNDGSINSLDFEPFIDRLPGDRTRFFADIVIMDGGRNDGGLYPMAQILAASDTYLRAVHELWPGAPIVVLAPSYVTSTPENYRFGVEFVEGLGPTLAAVGGVLIDPLNERWIEPDQVPRFLWADGIHPSPEGHKYISERLVQALRSAGFADLPVTDPGPTPPAP